MRLSIGDSLTRYLLKTGYSVTFAIAPGDKGDPSGLDAKCIVVIRDMFNKVTLRHVEHADWETALHNAIEYQITQDELS